MKLFARLFGAERESVPSFDSARKAVERRDLSLAAALFDRILAEDPLQWDALAGRSWVALQSDHPALAERGYDAMIKLRPDLSEPYFGRGNALLALGRLESALADYGRVIELNARHAGAWCKRGIVLDRLGRSGEAIASFEEALLIDPLDAAAATNIVSVLGREGKLEQAKPHLERALSQGGPGVELCFTYGVLQHQLGLFEDAVRSFDYVLAQADAPPTLAAAYGNRGACLAAAGRFDDAMSSLDKALEINAEDHGLYLQRATLHQNRQQFEAAALDFSRALQLDPASIAANLGLGRAMRQLRRFGPALERYDAAISLDPNCLEARVQRGNILLELGHLKSACESFNNAVGLDADCVDALQGRAFTTMALGRPEAAISDLERVLEVNPGQPYLLGLMMHLRMQVYDWKDIEVNRSKLRTALEAGQAVAIPHHVLAILDSPPLQRRAAEMWVAREYPERVARASCSAGLRPAKMRIAYFSPDFRDHPVARQTVELFETHDRSRFEIFAISWGDEADTPLLRRLAGAFEKFIDVSHQSDAEVVQLCRTLGIEIAVDLGGHTERCRTGIFALRAAPIQLSYIGYLGTTGAPYMDYLLADSTLVPTGTREHYSESLVFLPSYQVNDSKRQTHAAVSRKAWGLPETGFVYGCFNASYKVTPEAFAAWMRILQCVPGSVLVLLAESEVARNNLTAAAAGLGVSPERLIFGERLPIEQYLSRFRAVDVFLDTWPYNAGTTASDALWAGLPVVSLAGQSFAARIGASILHGIGLPDLVTTSIPDYENLAVALAQHPGRLAEFRQRLERARSAELFDTTAFTRSLEAGLLRMREDWEAGVRPRDIRVGSVGRGAAPSAGRPS